MREAAHGLFIKDAAAWVAWVGVPDHDDGNRDGNKHKDGARDRDDGDRGDGKQGGGYTHIDYKHADAVAGADEEEVRKGGEEVADGVVPEPSPQG